MLTYALPVAVFLFVTFLSVATFNRGKFGWSTALGFMWAAGAYLITLAVAAIATAATGPDNLRWSKPIDGEINTTVQNAETTYSFTSNGKTVVLGQDPDNSSDDTVNVVDSPDGTRHWDYYCDETPDWAAPYTLSSCHNYLYVPLGD